MQVNEIKEFKNQVAIKVNSKFPAGQGYSPVMIQENHYNISLNGHRINISESAFKELLLIFDNFSKEDLINKKEEKLEQIKQENKEEEIIDEELIDLRRKYVNKYKQSYPVNMKNNKEWLKGKLK